jgi:hypothetical protein
MAEDPSAGRKLALSLEPGPQLPLEGGGSSAILAEATMEANSSSAAAGSGPATHASIDIQAYVLGSAGSTMAIDCDPPMAEQAPSDGPLMRLAGRPATVVGVPPGGGWEPGIACSRTAATISFFASRKIGHGVQTPPPELVARHGLGIEMGLM